MSRDQITGAVQSAHPFDLGIIAAGGLAFLLSVFPYYTVSFDGGFGFGAAGGSISAWHGLFGWFGALAALAGAAVLALALLGVKLGIPTRLVSVAGFGVAALCVVLALFVIPGRGDCAGIKVCEDAVNYGHGFGYWVSVLVIGGGLALSLLRIGAPD